MMGTGDGQYDRWYQDIRNVTAIINEKSEMMVGKVYVVIAACVVCVKKKMMLQVMMGRVLLLLVRIPLLIAELMMLVALMRSGV